MYGRKDRQTIGGYRRKDKLKGNDIMENTNSISNLTGQYIELLRIVTEAKSRYIEATDNDGYADKEGARIVVGELSAAIEAMTEVLALRIRKRIEDEKEEI